MSRTDRGWVRELDALAGSHRAQQVRSIRDDAVDPHVDQTAHVLRIVDGPDDDREAQAVSLGDRAYGHILVERRPDLPARGLDRTRYRPAVLHRIEPSRPGRALIEVDVLLGLLHLREIDGRDFGGLLLHQEQRSPIEGFDHDAVGEVLAAQETEHRGYEALRIERLFRVCRVDLGLNVQP